MLKFFRKIRQRLLTENKFSKYLLYAVGEIVLVVIGILIALQINNWNESRKSEKSTKVYIARLIEDLKSDTLMLSNHIKQANNKFKLSKEIKLIHDNHNLLTDTIAFVVKLQAVGRLDLPAISTNTFDDLKSTGNLKLIKDFEVSESIRSYYNSVPNSWFTKYYTQLVDGYLPIVVDAIPMPIHEEILGKELDNIDANILYLGNEISTISPNDINYILNYLNKNQEFDFQLKRITRSHLVHAKLVTSMKQNAIELLKKLNNLSLKNIE